MMRLVDLDLETHLVQPGLITPPIVCGSVAEFDPEEMVRPGATTGRLLTKTQAIDTAWQLLEDPQVIIANSNIVFDFGCLVAADPALLPLVFRKYKQGLVHEIFISQALHAIYHGHLFLEPNGMPMLSAKGTQTERYSQDICVRQVLGRTDAKDNDFWRLRYALLEHLPQEQWPWEARQYPVDDAVFGVLVAAVQRGMLPRPPNAPYPDLPAEPGAVYPLGFGPYPPYDNYLDLAAQCETDWALHLGAIWGLRTDESRVDLLEARAQELHEAYVKKFTAHGFFRAPRPKYIEKGKIDSDAGKKDTAAVARAVATAYGATGVCEKCGGNQRVRPLKAEPCRGVKVKNRFQGCLAGRVDPITQGEQYCQPCSNTGQVFKAGNEVVCDACVGTGYADLSLVPMTDGGESGVKRVSASRDTLSESGDEDLNEFGENKFEKCLGTYLPYLRKGLTRPLNIDPNVLVESGRSSASGVIMLFPRGMMGMAEEGEWMPSLRECVVARPGTVFGSSDFPAGELCAFSQLALWTVKFSRMADIINATLDPGAIHTEFGARMIGVEPEELKKRMKVGDKVAKGFRQAAKPWDFGALGGMGSCKLVLTNRKEGAGTTDAPNGRRYPGIRFCVLVGGKSSCGDRKLRQWGKKGYEREIPPTCQDCLEIAEYQIKPLFFDTFPEVREYHKWVKRMMEQYDDHVPCFGPWYVEHRHPHRVRRVESFTSGANNGFQAYIADITKDALRAVTREAYLEPDSVLYQANTRVPSFQHDELLSCMNEDLAHLAGPRIGWHMHEAYKRWIPDVHIEGVDTALMRHWNKDAEAVYDADGKLVVWEPKVKK